MLGSKLREKIGKRVSGGAVSLIQRVARAGGQAERTEGELNHAGILGGTRHMWNGPG